MARISIAVISIAVFGEKDEEDVTEEPSSANIYSGELVSLQIKGGSFIADNEWLSCTERNCRVGTCPGKRLKDDDITSCPNFVFTLHKVFPGNESSTMVVRVGDSIVLEHLTPEMMPAEGQSRDDSGRLFVSCNPQTAVCSLSSSCVTEAHHFNASYCRENVLIVRVEGKAVGEPITHKDLIGFEFEMPHDPFFHVQCALGCDPATKICSKKLCVFSNTNSDRIGGGNQGGNDFSNSLGNDISNSLGNGLSNSLESTTVPPTTAEAPKCGKDMFFIRKY